MILGQTPVSKLSREGKVTREGLPIFFCPQLPPFQLLQNFRLFYEDYLTFPEEMGPEKEKGLSQPHTH